MPNPLTVPVTITKNGNALTITVPSNVLSVPNQGSDHTGVPIFWEVAEGSSPGAQITNVTFPWPAPPVQGYTFTQWPGAAPASQPGGKWMVTCRNNNPGPGHVYFKYNIYASVASTTGELDPIVDNDPPPTP